MADNSNVFKTLETLDAKEKEINTRMEALRQEQAALNAEFETAAGILRAEYPGLADRFLGTIKKAPGRPRIRKDEDDVADTEVESVVASPLSV